MAMSVMFAVVVVTSAVPAYMASKTTDVARAAAGDEVSLLQGQVEMKKSEGYDVSHFVKKATYSSGDLCPGNSNAASSFPVGKQDEEIIMESISSAQVVEACAPQAAMVSPSQNRQEKSGISKKSLVRGLLEVFACLLVVDVLRRYSSKQKVATTDSGSLSAKAPGCPSIVSALLAAALDADDAAFDKALACVTASQLKEADRWGCTPLHYAAKGGSAPIVSRLLDFEVRIDAIDAWDETPLHLAARAGHADACKALLSVGACIDATNAEEHTPLVVAGQAGQADVCSLLIEHGACVAGLAEQEVPRLVTELLAQKTSE